MSPCRYNIGDTLICCEESTELIPLCDLHKSSTIAFNIDDGIVKTELTDFRSCDGSICSSSSSLTNELSDKYKDFKKKIKILLLFYFVIFIMAPLWLAYLWWDQTNNDQEHGEADLISTWNWKIFPSA